MVNHRRASGNSHDLFDEWQEAAQQFGVSARRNDAALAERSHAASGALRAFLDAVSHEMGVLKISHRRCLDDHARWRARIAALLRK